MKRIFYKVLSLVLCVTMLFTMNCVSFAYSEIEDEYNYVSEENVIPEDEKTAEKSGIMSFFENVKAYFLMFVIVVVGAVGGKDSVNVRTVCLRQGVNFFRVKKKIFHIPLIAVNQ